MSEAQPGPAAAARRARAEALRRLRRGDGHRQRADPAAAPRRVALHLRRDRGDGVRARASAWRRRWRRAKAAGPGPRAGPARGRRGHRRTSSPARSPSASGSTTWTCSIFKTDVAALNLIGPPAARRLGSVPIGFDEHGHLLVAMADPSNVLALDDLKLMTGHEVMPVVGSSDDIHGLIGRMSRLDDAVAAAVKEGEDELAEVTEIRESADDAPVIKLVNSIIAQGVEDGASDIHFEPDGRDMRVRFRVDGVLRESTHIPRRMVPGTISRVKIMANLDIAEKRVPQDGRVSLTVEGHAIDLRVVTMPHVDGEGDRDADPGQDPGADRARPAGHVEPRRA